jgi:hypothetical protein
MSLLKPTCCAAALAVTLAAAPLLSHAAVVYTPVATPPSTPADNPAGGNSDGTGVWFNPLTGYAEVRGFLFPDPLYEDGRFFLLRDTFSYATPEAEVFVRGLFSRGNGVIHASPSSLNPARFATGVSIGPASGFQSPRAGFPDRGPVFGNWAAGRPGLPGPGRAVCGGPPAAPVSAQAGFSRRPPRRRPPAPGAG